MFSAFRHRDYLLYWIGAFVSFTGSWVQTVCYGWLTYQITNSKFWLGLIGFVGSLPLLLLTLFGGALIDRVNKRRMLIITQSLFAIFAVILGMLYSSGVLTKANPSARYYILTVALLQGIVMSVDIPLRQSMPSSLVPKESLMNAIVLNSAAFNLARMTGPAVAAWLMARSITSCFYVNAASFLAVIAALVFMRTNMAPRNDKSRPIVSEVSDGLKYIRSNRQISKLMLMIAISAMFVMPYMTLMPVFARDVLKSGQASYGLLFTSIGLGAFIGAIVLARLSSLPRRGWIIIVSSFFGGLFMLAFANSHSMYYSRILLVGVGFMVVSFNQTSNSLIQYHAKEEYMGRVMAAFTFLFVGLSPLANLQAGILAEAIGAPLTVSIWAVIFFATAFYVATQKDLREI